MQVGLNSSTLSNTGSLTSSVNQQTVNQNTVNKNTAVNSYVKQPASDYPASPLISTRPQRYSVQLNDQLTVIQQADHYLGQLEQTLLEYRHTSRRGGAAAKQSMDTLQQLLEKRTSLSGGTVDRQLSSVLQGKARVNFHAPALSHALQKQGEESLLFSAQDGRQTKLAAVFVSGDMDARQYQVAMKNALRRVGIQMQESQRGDAPFSTEESNWPQLQNSLGVLGGGIRFPAGNTTALAPQAEPSLTDDLLNVVKNGSNRGQQVLQQSLEVINQQRSQIAIQQEKARQLIDGMSRFPESQNALQASKTLSGTLDNANHNYDVLAQAVNGQAKLSARTVRGLLSEEE